MSISISIFVLITIITITFIGGFWVGRSVRWMMLDTESNILEEDSEELSGYEETNRPDKSSRNMGRRIQQGLVIGSPVAGEVRSFCEGNRRGAWIRPVEGKLHAPASGKITRLYPMGNAMLLRTDAGVELMLRVGENRDEMYSKHYRVHVVQNEIVNRGKLLLEFDKEGLQAEGVDIGVSISVEAAEDFNGITVTHKEQVKVGEELLWVSEAERM